MSELAQEIALAVRELYVGTSVVPREDRPRIRKGWRAFSFDFFSTFEKSLMTKMVRQYGGQHFTMTKSRYVNRSTPSLGRIYNAMSFNIWTKTDLARDLLRQILRSIPTRDRVVEFRSYDPSRVDCFLSGNWEHFNAGEINLLSLSSHYISDDDLTLLALAVS